MDTQVGIIGAGPAGLMLSHLLQLHGIDSVVVEARSEDYVLGRVRAGVLDYEVSQLMIATGLGDRMLAEGMEQSQMEYRFSGKRRYVNWYELAGGRKTMVYGQQEVVRDLIAKRHSDGGDIRFESGAVEIGDLVDGRPVIHYEDDSGSHSLTCDFVAACDGFHGVGRRSIPKAVVRTYERTYPFAWLGIVAEVPPSSDWLVTGAHDRGYAMHSMRSPFISRNYVQCAITDTVQDWPDDRVWEELHVRLASDDGWTLKEGPVVAKSKIDLRSFVCEPMQYGRMFLAGDAAHVVPPTGGRGLNQAIADVCVLADSIQAYYASRDERALQRYSATCLERVWQAQEFTSRQSNMLQRHDFEDEYHRKLQLAQLEYVTSNRAALTSLAQSYAGGRLQTSFLDPARPDYPRYHEDA